MLQLTREKHQCSHRSQCVWLMHQGKNAQTVKSAPRLYTKQMCNRNLTWSYKSPFSHDRYWNWYRLRLKQTHLHTTPLKQLENKSLILKNVYCWLLRKENKPLFHFDLFRLCWLDSKNVGIVDAEMTSTSVTLFPFRWTQFLFFGVFHHHVWDRLIKTHYIVFWCDWISSPHFKPKNIQREEQYRSLINWLIILLWCL